MIIILDHLNHSISFGGGFCFCQLCSLQTEDEEMSAVEPKYNGKADVYSFAITCCEVLTGKPPFDKDVKRGSISKLVRIGVRPKLPVEINTKLSSLIKECWETDPQKRPTFESICAKLQEIKVWETEAQNWPTFHWRSCFTIC